LRQAVIDACPNSIITFDMTTVVSPIVLTTGEISINKNLTIQGPGAAQLTISGNNASRIFYVSVAGVNSTISRLTLTNGNGAGPTNTGRGGALYNNGATMNMVELVITGNTAVNGGGFNTAGNGTTTLTNSTLSNNTALTSSGGGFQNFAGSTTHIYGSTISGNTANSSVGGGAMQANGTVTITNSTISGNTAASSGNGGGISFNGTALTIVNSTIANNTALANGGGVYRTGVNPFTVVNTIIAGNSATTSGPDAFGAYTSLGYNLVGKTDGSTGFTEPTDLTGTIATPLDPLLGPLANNGGPTFTHILLSSSPAIDKGSAANNPVTSNPLVTDQRNLVRPVDNPVIPNAAGGNGSDIGAVELPLAALPPTVTIDQAIGQADPTSTSPINFTAVFSEAVNGFTGADINFTGSTAGGTLTATVTGAGPTYNVAVSGMTTSGTVVASIPAGAATSVATGTPSTASTSTDNTVTYNAVPPNDNCANAIALSCSSTVSGTTIGATIDGPPTSCTAGSVAADVWYTVVGNGANITASLCGAGTTYDSKIDIYTGSCGSLSSVACDDDFCGPFGASQVTWLSAAGTTYYIRVHGFAGATGNFVLNITCACIAPAITCPANITVNNNPGLCGAVVNYPAATATGFPAPTITYSHASGSTFPVGVTTVTATATNTCGTATCTFTITVNDTQAPVLTCPANITVNNAAGLCAASVATPNPTNTDNCAVTVRTWALTGATTGASPATGLNNVGTQTFNVGVTTVTYTSSDAAGNTSTCSFTVTVNDVQPPVITCPANVTVSNDPGLCSAVVNYALPSASDNCNRLQVPQTILAHGSGAITFGGNNAPGGFYFNISNNSATPKTISSISVRFGSDAFGAVPSPAPVSVYVTTSANTYIGNQTNAGAWTAVGTNIPVTVAGPNSEFSLVPLPNGGFTLAPGQTKGMYVLGTVSSLLYNGAGFSNTTPISNGVITVTPGQASSGLFVAGASPRIPNVIINYITLTQTAGLPSGSAFPVGTTTNTYVATDDAGNTSSCSFTVRVNDTQAPTITCPGNITVTSPAGSCTAVVNYTATVNDNCPGATVQVVSGLASGSAFPVGTTTVILRAVDAAGNVSANCSFTVTVLDGQLPVITVQPQNRTVCAGQNATFSVTAITSPNANGPLSYQWQSWNGSAWVNVSGATSSTFTVSNTTVSQNTNSYRVQVIGLCTTITSAHATLYVNPNPTVSLTTNVPPAILPTQSVTITAVPSIGGGSYQWFKNGVAIAGATSQTLGPLTVADIGNYRVVYTSPAGCVGTSADLAVTGLATPNLYVYPNPNRGQFTVQFYNQSNEEVTLRIIDAKGALVYQRKYATTLPYTNINVNLADGRILTAGVYVVVVLDSSGKQIGTRRIIVYQ
jgi:hypothetical protein